MNQIIVILIIIKKWFKYIKPNLLNLFLLVIALIGIIYCYLIYNHVQEQHFTFEYDIKGKHKVDSVKTIISLNYASSEPKQDYDKVQNKLVPIQSGVKIISYISNIDTTFSTIGFSELIHWFSSYQGVWGSGYGMSFSEKSSRLLSADVMISNTMNFTSDDNAWFFLRSKGGKLANYSEHVRIEDIQPHSAKLLYVKQTDRIYSFDSYDFYIGRKMYNIEYHYADAKSYNDDLKGGKDTIITGYEIKEGLYEPHFYSAYDVSKINLKFNFRSEDTLSHITLSFLDLMELSNANPSPDVVSSVSLEYTNPEKIRYIYANGLDCFVRFPKAENLQHVRNYIISALITLFFTLFCTVLWNIIRVKYRERKRYDVICIDLLTLRHKDLFFKFKQQRLLSNCIVGFFISFLVYLISPKKGWFVISCLIIVFAYLLPILLYSISYIRAAENKVITKKEFVNYVKKESIYCFLPIPILLLFFYFYLFKKSNDSEMAFILSLVAFLLILFIYLIALVISQRQIKNLFKQVKANDYESYFKRRMIFSVCIIAIDICIYLVTFRLSPGVIFLFTLGATMLIYSCYKIKK